MTGLRPWTRARALAAQAAAAYLRSEFSRAFTGTYDAKYVPRSNRSIQEPGPSENDRSRKAISCSFSIVASPPSERGGDRRELAIELDRGRKSAEGSYGELRRGSIGGGVADDEKSMMGCMRRLHRDAGGDMGVPTADVGADCINGGKASSSGV